MGVCDRNCVILQTIRARCTLNEETVSGARSGRAPVYKFDKKSTASVLKGELIAKVPFKLFWWSHT